MGHVPYLLEAHGWLGTPPWPACPATTLQPTSHLCVTGCESLDSPGERSSYCRWGSGVASHWCVYGCG